MKRTTLVILLTILLVTTSLSSMTFASTVTISGKILDSKGAAVPGAPVKLFAITDTQLKNGSVASTVGAKNGTYTLTAPSTKTSYFIRVQKAGYTYTLKVLYVGTTNIINYNMTVAADLNRVAVTGVSVTPTNLKLALGGITTLTVTISPSNATNKGVAWTSNNKAVATVNSTTGKVTAVATGTANITVTTADGGMIATSVVTIGSNIPVTGVTLNETTLALNVGTTHTLVAIVIPSNATNKSLTWGSSNTAVASVHSAGQVTAKAAGTATIKVTTVDGGKTATCSVTSIGIGDIIIDVNPLHKKPVNLKVGYNEYVITQNPFHPFDDPTYVALMRDSGATVMRFPGGTIANFYDWGDDDFFTEEIADMKANAAQAVPREKFANQADYDAQVASYEDYLQSYINKGSLCREYRTTPRGVYGYTDFLSLADQIGADIYYVGNVSMAPAGVDPIDHLVAWMQDIESKGRAVKYLELGNEIVSPRAWTNNQAIPNGLYDLDRYLSICKTISERVKAIFPNIKIGILADGIGNKLGREPGNIDTICRYITSSSYGTDFFDAVIIHSYLRVRDGNLVELQDAKERVFANGKVMVENNVDYWRRIFAGKEIWMTETGYVKKATDIDITGTMLNAMLEADYILRWADDDVVASYIKFFSIAAKDGATATDGTKYVSYWNNDGIINEPTYYSNKMIFNTLKKSSDMLETNIRNNTFITRQVSYYGLDANGVLTYKPNTPISVEQLSARAYLSKDGFTISIPFVNQNATAVDVILNLNGAAVTGTAQIQWISGALLDKNTVTAPYTISPVSTSFSAGEVITLPAYSIGVIEINDQING